ncbi:MarR family transcriptional regulator [Sneathiella glossodoripedis]|uniref:MarR family transcriptional regulator n=1 Tax=Sneathiella glossodoripedis TaxID=418853 RepID=UPI00046F8252|nr:MarR family transcriptional regulator [Sneathiella glossodoripedis]
MKNSTTQATLNMWKQALGELVRRQGPDLSSRQMAILLIVYLEEPPHTVRGLAARLKISKPAVTRALDTMGKLDLLRRKPDEKDLRSVNIVRTVKGSVYLSEIADVIEKAAWENLG